MKLIFIALFLVLSVCINAQNTVGFTYDDAGNRTSRYIVLDNPPPASVYKEAVQNKDTIAQEQTPTEQQMVFNETFGGEKQLLIYPNPTKGQLRIECKGYENEIRASAYLYNLSGALLMERKLVNSYGILDLSAYPNATYILKIILGGDVSEWKIIKQ